MSVSDNRRSEVQAAEHLAAIEKFADFAGQSAAGLRTETVGAALSAFLRSFLHFAVGVVVLDRPTPGFPIVDACEASTMRERWIGALLPQLRETWETTESASNSLELPSPGDLPAGDASDALAAIAVEPICQDGVPLGLLAVGSRRADVFGPAERSLLALVARQLAIVLHNARQFANVERMNQDILEGQEQLQDLSLLMQYSSSAIVVFERVANGDTFVTSWNDGAQKAFGYGAEEMRWVPNALDRLFPEAGDEPLPPPPWEWTDDKRVDHEVTLQDADGKAIQFLATAVVHAPIQGEASRCLMILEDISTQKAALEALERKNQELERFARVVSHDLKSPLALIGGYAELLTDTLGDGLDATTRKFLSTMQTQTQKMSDFVESLLEFARTGQTEPVLSRLSMDEVVNLALAELTYQLHSIDATVDIADRLPVVLADETRMGQVWRNLIGNAVKYRDPNRRLHIKIGVDKNPEGGWAFHISDTGVGIPDDQLRKVFDLYHRVDEKRKADSTGLGLAMVKRIVEQHSGEVWVTSRVGEGSTFTFTLPPCQPGEAS